MQKRTVGKDGQGGAALEITPAMIAAGVERYLQLTDASAAYLVSEVLEAALRAYDPPHD